MGRRVKCFYGDDYYASDCGNIFSTKYKKERILRTYAASGGYLYLKLMVDGKKKGISVHRLVYSSFYGKIPAGMEIDHIDGNKNNNSLSNLQCVTREENMFRARKMRLRKICGPRRTKELTNEEIFTIRFFHSSKPGTLKSLAKIFNRSKHTIMNVVRRRSYDAINP